LMHEINNPLDAVGNLVYLTLQDADNAQLIRTDMCQIEEQVMIIKRIIDQTLGLTRPSPMRKREKFCALAEAAFGPIAKRSPPNRSIFCLKFRKNLP
jgi:hypothetical protein